MMAKQRTIANEASLSGVGIHSGKSCAVRFKPASTGAGIRFSKNGRSVDPRQTPDARRCTSIGDGEDRILTVEHALAALAGLGITNVLIEVDGPEMPILDGSAAGYVESLKKAGIVEQPQEREVYKIREPIFCHDKTRAIAVYPSENFSVSYTLDYDHPRLKDQKVDFAPEEDVFEKEVASARTFCTEEEAAALRSNGLGLGANHENTLVISKDGVVGNRLRFEDECARHKVLDILGDLNLLGFGVIGRVVALRSGHALNRRLAEEIRRQRDSYGKEK